MTKSKSSVILMLFIMDAEPATRDVLIVLRFVPEQTNTSTKFLVMKNVNQIPWLLPVTWRKSIKVVTHKWDPLLHKFQKPRNTVSFSRSSLKGNKILFFGPNLIQ
jgi:hypothetical protein